MDLFLDIGLLRRILLQCMEVPDSTNFRVCRTVEAALCKPRFPILDVQRKLFVLARPILRATEKTRRGGGLGRCARHGQVHHHDTEADLFGK